MARKLKRIIVPDSQGNPIEYDVGGVDADTASAGQVLMADGAGGTRWGDVEAGGDAVPTEVRQAIFNLLDNNAFANDDAYANDLAVLQSWATEITSISVSPTALSINGQTTGTIVAATQPVGGIISWSSSDETIATVTNGVVTPTGVNGACTITARCGGKSAVCAVTVSGFATLTGISAVYTQSGTVYDTDSLDSLKSDLVVTANYDDSTTQAVTGYTLSGTLTEGTSTITATYGGKSTTFNVTVTSISEDITVTWTNASTSLTDIIDARNAEIYWTLPFIEGSSEYVEGTTADSDFVRIRAYLYDGPEATTPVGYWYMDTEEIESSSRTTLNTPSMPTNTLTKVAPSGYYVKLGATKRGAFTSNATCSAFLNANANTVKLVGTRS